MQAVGDYAESRRLFMFSGGSALEIIKHLPEDFFLPSDTITVLDERYTQDERDSNFAALAKLFNIRCLTIDPRPLTGESLEDTAGRFEVGLKRWKQDNPEGKIIITQGIGEDGHTAGILPFPEDKDFFSKTFEEKGDWVAGCSVSADKNTHRERVTVTVDFLLNEVDFSLIYISGMKKSAIFAKLVSGGNDFAAMPMFAIGKMKKAIIVTDIEKNW